MSLALARREGLVVRELPRETLVYDLKAGKAHCLNGTAALVWRHCDGETTVAELAALLHRELGLPADEAPVRLALEQLSRRGLLEQPAPARRGRGAPGTPRRTAEAGRAGGGPPRHDPQRPPRQRPGVD